MVVPTLESWRASAAALRRCRAAAIPCVLLPLLLSSCAPGLLPDRIPLITSEATVARRAAERELRRAELWTLDTYRGMAEFSRGYPRPPCDSAGGQDCFGGEYECPHCLWHEDGREIRRLGLVYDTVGSRMLAPPRNTSVYRLNWLAGQRTGLWTRRGELERARTAAEECRGEFWWCESLHGLVAQRSGDYAAAEAYFDRALQQMPEARRCYWDELVFYSDSVALSVGHDGYGRLMRRFGTLDSRPCPDEEGAATFWTLSDPLWSVPGNARRAEHYARMTDMQIHHHFLETMYPHGAHEIEHHSVVLRHGWPTGFNWRGGQAVVRERQGLMPVRPGFRRRGQQPGPPAQRGEIIPTTPRDPFETPATLRLFYGRGQGFTITLPLEDALQAAPDVFVPRDHTEMESYAPPFGHVHPLSLQTGFFRRDGRDLLVLRSAVPARNVPPANAWRLVAWNGSEFRDAPVRAAGDTLSATFHTPWEPQIVSIEALIGGATTGDGAWRGRSGTRPPEAGADVAISSVILIDDAGEPAANLDDAISRMLPTTRLAAGTRAGVYWELYATSPVNAVVEISVRRTERPGLLSRILGARPPELRVRWEELFDDVGTQSRTYDLDLHTLLPGSYQMEFTLSTHEGETLRSDALFSITAATPTADTGM